MKQFTYKEPTRNLDRFIDERGLILKHECPEWIMEHLQVGRMMCDLFGANKVREMIKNIGLDYKSIFDVVFIESGSNAYDGWILLEPRIARSKDGYTGVGKNRRYHPSVYVDAYAIESSWGSPELSRLLEALFLSIDERLTGKTLSKIGEVNVNLADIKVNDLIKSYDIGEMTLIDAYSKLRWEKKTIEKKRSKIKLYCYSPYIVFIETDKGTIHLPLEELIKGDRKECDDVMLKYLYQYAYKDREDKLGWMKELKDTPEYKVIEDIFFNKDDTGA